MSKRTADALSCPYCRKQALSAWRKVCLGPLLSAACQKCDRPVGVPFGKSFLAMMPFFTALVFPLPVLTLAVLVFGDGFLNTLSLPVGIGALVCWLGVAGAAWVFGVYLYLNWVPLMRR